MLNLAEVLVVAGNKRLVAGKNKIISRSLVKF